MTPANSQVGLVFVSFLEQWDVLSSLPLQLTLEIADPIYLALYPNVALGPVCDKNKQTKHCDTHYLSNKHKTRLS